jgi:hypothetical protein
MGSFTPFLFKITFKCSALALEGGSSEQWSNSCFARKSESREDAGEIDSKTGLVLACRSRQRIACVLDLRQLERVASNMPDRQSADTDSKPRQDESSLGETKINIENVCNFAHFFPATLELHLDIVARSRFQSLVSAPKPEFDVETFSQR